MLGFAKKRSTQPTPYIPLPQHPKNRYNRPFILKSERQMITLQTNYGNITIELDTKNTPKTAENFLAYAKKGFYDGNLFHRVINNFMIQAGGFDEKMQQKKTKATIQNEANKSQTNKR